MGDWYRWCLKSTCIEGDGPSSVLLDHLLIPFGAELKIRGNLLRSLVGENLPRSLGNLKNFSDFAAVQLHLAEYYQRIIFSGPNGKVSTIFRTFRDDYTGLALESLAGLDTSKIRWPAVDGGYLLSGEPLYQALLPIKDFRTLTVSKCRFPDVHIHALQPATSSSEVVVCPKLEGIILVLQVCGGLFDVTSITGMAAARASGGKKLKTIRIIGRREETDFDMSELRKCVRNVEYGPEV